MHWVDRGAEPNGLPPTRARYAKRWVDFYQNGVGRLPTDTRWGDFREDLKRAFSGICGYCEQIDNGEIDHFRPKSRFPTLVYEWTNWIWACHDCNYAKLNKWPECGYINPCVEFASEEPEKYFRFALQTGEILPNDDLNQDETAKAWQIIDDLKLNGDHHMRVRQSWVLVLSEALAVIPTNPSAAQLDFVSRISARSAHLSSISRQLIQKFGL